MSNHSTSARVFGLDLLRAVAILAVLAGHSTLLIRRGLVRPITMFAPGFFGVELFFVLSGFLIGTILISKLPELNRIQGLGTFWVRRWMRTIPNYLLFLGINILVALLLDHSLPKLLPYLTFTQNLIYAQPNFFPESWSLAVEEWFYLSFPLLVFVGLRWLKLGDRTILVVAALFLIVPMALRVYQVTTFDPDWRDEIRKVTLLRLDALMYGVLAAWVKSRYPSWWQQYRKHALLGGIILWMLMLGLLRSRGIEDFRAIFFFTFTPLSVALVLPFLDHWQVQTETVVTRAVRSIALWSYSLYLCHVTVVVLLDWLGDTYPDSVFGSQWFAWGSFFVICIAVSAFTYTFFEKPTTNLRDKIHFSGAAFSRWRKYEVTRHPAGDGSGEVHPHLHRDAKNAVQVLDE